MMPLAEGLRDVRPLDGGSSAMRSCACSSALGGVAVCRIRPPAHRSRRRARARRRARDRILRARAEHHVPREGVAAEAEFRLSAPTVPARFVESELRLSWEPSPEDPTPKEARTLRQVLQRQRPRAAQEGLRQLHHAGAAGLGRAAALDPAAAISASSSRSPTAAAPSIDGRDAIIVTFRETVKPTVDVSLVEDNENCISFDIEGGMRGQDLDRRRDARRAAPRSIADRPDRDPAAAQGAALRRQLALDDGAVGFVDPVQAGDVRRSAGDAGAAGRIVDAADHPRRPARRACAPPRSTRPTAASSPAPASFLQRCNGLTSLR